MLLVLLILAIIVFLFTILLILFVSNLQIEMQNLIVKSKEKTFVEVQNGTSLQGKIEIKLKLFGEITILKATLSSARIRRMCYKVNLKKWERKLPKLLRRPKMDRNILKAIKKMKIEIKQLDLQMYIGTEDAITTSYLVATIASLLGIVYPHVIKENYKDKCKFFVNPLYENKNRYFIKINTNIEVEIANIIKVFLQRVKEKEPLKQILQNKQKSSIKN